MSSRRPSPFLVALCCTAALSLGMFASRSTSLAQQPSPESNPHPYAVFTDAVYRVNLQYEGKRAGSTRNVEVTLYRDKGQLHRRITALEGNQFALKPLTSEQQNQVPGLRPTPAERLLAPVFLPGDSAVSVKIDPEVGFTEFLFLKILDPVVLAIEEDGLLGADRAGVRAVFLNGQVNHTECFAAMEPVENEQGQKVYDFKRLLAPEYNPDGSWTRPVGEFTDCVVDLQGTDGEHFVTRERTENGKRRFVFLLSREMH